MELSMQERLKALRVERGLTLERLAEETYLSKSALGSYEGGQSQRHQVSSPFHDLCVAPCKLT